MTNANLGQIILLLILLVLTVSLVVFSQRLHILTAALGDATKRSAQQNERLEETVDRMEEATKVVAHNLAATITSLDLAARQRVVQGRTIDRMEAATFVVADNLADAHSRADAAQGPEGAAADAAVRTQREVAKDIHERQKDPDQRL